MLTEERARLHPVPAAPLPAALGVTRRVDAMSLVTFEGGQYSVPHPLAGQAVYVRRHGGQVVITCAGPSGPAEVARHQVTTPGTARVRAKMAEAVQLAALHGAAATDRALGQAAAAGRFADGDLAAILAHQASAAPGEPARVGEQSSLAQGTGGWARQTGTGETR
jgi:hypothetical protein